MPPGTPMSIAFRLGRQHFDGAPQAALDDHITVEVLQAGRVCVNLGDGVSARGGTDEDAQATDIHIRIAAAQASASDSGPGCTAAAGSRPWRADRRDIEQLIAVMEQHPDAPWTGQMLADHVGITVGQLARLFRAVTGWPPMAYLANLRAQAMARLI